MAGSSGRFKELAVSLNSLVSLILILDGPGAAEGSSCRVVVCQPREIVALKEASISLECITIVVTNLESCVKDGCALKIPELDLGD